MLGIVSKKSAEREWLERFRRLAHTGLLPKGKKGHKDGWGIGFFDGGVPRVLKEPEDAYQSAFFSEVLKKRLPTRLIAHLRHASHGLMTFEHTHPFIIDDMLFCHNGTIYAESEEESDSEFYFGSIVRAHKKDPLKEAIIKTAEGMKKKFRCTSLSLLLITPGCFSHIGIIKCIGATIRSSSLGGRMPLSSAPRNSTGRSGLSLITRNFSVCITI